MTAPQLALGLDVTTINIAKLIRWKPVTDGARWRVGGTGRMSGQAGRGVGIISLRRHSGYEVVLQFDDGSIDTFAPLSLYPDLPAR